MKKLLVFVVLLAAGAGAAYHFGYLDRLLPGGLGGARLIPKDPKLLGYFRPDARELAVVNLTELDFRLSSDSQAKLEKDWRELHEKAGIDVRKDVDALAGADGLGVARGRFDWGKLGPYLQSQGYTLTQVGGVPAAVKHLAADVALDGNYLLVGPRAELEQAIARKQKGQGLGDSSPIVKALDDIGWRHGLVGGAVTGSRLSSQGPADLKLPTVMGALDSTRDGFELRAVAVTTSKEEGEALHATLEVLRKAALLQMAITTQPEVRTLRDSLERATLEVDKLGRVTGAIRVPYALMDQASANVSAGNLAPALQAMELPNESEDSAPTSPPAVTPQPPSKEDAQPPAPAPAPATSATVSHSLDWKPPVFGVILLVIALVTMGAATRPGMFNVLFHPLFLLPFLISTLGVFVLRWTGQSGGAFDVLALPMPEWYRFVSFPVAQTVALSAAIPMLLAIISGPVSLLRRVAAGLAVGFSAYLATKALGGASLPLIPPAYAVIWYAGNAVAALLLARLTIPPRRSKQSAAPGR
jgi:hypothetical protein